LGIIPACFAYDLDVGAGPSLLFVTLPRILQDIPAGRLFAVILYTAMAFAGISSLQNMFEAVGESLQNRIPTLNSGHSLFQAIQKNFSTNVHLNTSL
jgi:NSS family neurotransmitter:Na+ symporter